MLKSQSALIEMSKVREEINALPDDAEADTLNGLTARYQRTEAAYRAALIAEGQDNAAAAPSEDGQPAEVRGLLKRASLGIYLTGTAAQQEVAGLKRSCARRYSGMTPELTFSPSICWRPRTRRRLRNGPTSLPTSGVRRRRAGPPSPEV